MPQFYLPVNAVGWRPGNAAPKKPAKSILNMANNANNVDLLAVNGKEVLTSRETAAYLGISLGYLYKLTMEKKIPHYKPEGKILYFNRTEVEAWMRQQAAARCRKGGRTL